MEFSAALPHGPITPVTDGVYIVRGSFQMGPGMRIGRSMTIVQEPEGLTILNAVRLSAAGEQELERLGKVKHLIKLSDSHGIDEPYYVDRYKPEVWALPNAKLGQMRATQTLGPGTPIAGSVVLHFPGTNGWRECALWLKAGGGTLVACDALQNHADGEGTSFVGRMITPLLGFKGGVIVAARDFQNLVTGHGPAVVGGADELVRTAIEAAARG